jgi:hypothetical protein
MTDDTDEVDNEGGSNIQGDANAGRDFIVGDQHNHFYNSLPQKKAAGRDLLDSKDVLMSKAYKAQLEGDLFLAQELYAQILEVEPHNIVAKRELLVIQKELGMDYVDASGRVVSKMVIREKKRFRIELEEKTEIFIRRIIRSAQVDILLVIVYLGLMLTITYRLIRELYPFFFD